MKLYTYVGKTAKSEHERGGQHVYYMKNLSIASHKLKHVVDKHEGEKILEVEWRMKVLKSHKSSFERHVSESVSIPRLVLKMVSRNVGTSWETRERQDMSQDNIRKMMEQMPQMPRDQRELSSRTSDYLQSKGLAQSPTLFPT
jgi:hypothetical protein